MATISGALSKLRRCCFLIKRTEAWHWRAGLSPSLSSSSSFSLRSSATTSSRGDDEKSWEAADLGKQQQVPGKKQKKQRENLSAQFVDRIHVSSWKEVSRSLVSLSPGQDEDEKVLGEVNRRLQANLHKRSFYTEEDLSTLASHLAKLLIRQAYINQPTTAPASLQSKKKDSNKAIATTKTTTVLFSAFLEVLQRRFTWDEKRLFSSVLARLALLPPRTVEREVVEKALRFFVRKRDQKRDAALLDRDYLSKSIQALSKLKTKNDTANGRRRRRRAKNESKNNIISSKPNGNKPKGEEDELITISSTGTLVWDVSRVFRELPYTRAESVASFLQGAQELGFQPTNKGQKQFVSESLKEIVLSEDASCTDLARSLRTLLYWSNLGILNRGLVETVLGKFYAILSSESSSEMETAAAAAHNHDNAVAVDSGVESLNKPLMKPTYAAFMFGFISHKEDNFSSEQLDILMRYVLKCSSLGDIIEASERINRPIRYSFLQEFCNSYMAVVTADPDRYYDKIPDLLYGAAKTGLIVEAFKVHQLIEKFLDRSAGGIGAITKGTATTTKQIARMIYIIEKLDVSDDFNVDELIRDFYRSLQEQKATANELVIVLAAIASNKSSSHFRHDPLELISSFLDQVDECSRTELLPALQVILYLLISKAEEASAAKKKKKKAAQKKEEVPFVTTELDGETGSKKGRDRKSTQGESSSSTLAYSVAKTVFERFSQYKVGLFSSKEITEMLSTVAEVGYTPSMTNIRRCLQSIGKKKGEGKTTSLDLVNAMTALGRMEINFDERTKIVDAIIYSFGDNLETAASEDLANFLHSLAQLNFSPEASTLELLDKIDKLLIFRSKDIR
jgi:hypothetical protein